MLFFVKLKTAYESRISSWCSDLCSSDLVPAVVADLCSIKQIVLNILSNAIRFTPSGGQIVVSTVYEANGSVILRIRDTGIGMMRPELERLEEPRKGKGCVSTGSSWWSQDH